MILPISIIVPTFNEEKYLPKLLASIQKQTALPAEVIVADAFSTDNTPRIAKQFGAKLIVGGLPSVARNNGAKAAKQNLLLFLDADVVLPAAFLAKTFAEMQERDLAIASCFISPRSRNRIDGLLHQFANQYMKLTQKFYPHIPGFCIFIKKATHKAISGFDESLLLAEDHDYVRRARKFGKFGYLKSYKIPVSVRRLSEEGRIKLSLKYIAIELHLIFIGKIRTDIFNYKFGNHFKN